MDSKFTCPSALTIVNGTVDELQLLDELRERHVFVLVLPFGDAHEETDAVDKSHQFLVQLAKASVNDEASGFVLNRWKSYARRINHMLLNQDARLLVVLDGATDEQREQVWTENHRPHNWFMVSSESGACFCSQRLAAATPTIFNLVAVDDHSGGGGQPSIIKQGDYEKVHAQGTGYLNKRALCEILTWLVVNRFKSEEVAFRAVTVAGDYIATQTVSAHQEGKQLQGEINSKTSVAEIKQMLLDKKQVLPEIYQRMSQIDACCEGGGDVNSSSNAQGCLLLRKLSNHLFDDVVHFLDANSIVQLRQTNRFVCALTTTSQRLQCYELLVSCMDGLPRDRHGLCTASRCTGNIDTPLVYPSDMQLSELSAVELRRRAVRFVRFMYGIGAGKKNILSGMQLVRASTAMLQDYTDATREQFKVVEPPEEGHANKKRRISGDMEELVVVEEEKEAKFNKLELTLRRKQQMSVMQAKSQDSTRRTRNKYDREINFALDNRSHMFPRDLYHRTRDGSAASNYMLLGRRAHRQTNSQVAAFLRSVMLGRFSSSDKHGPQQQQQQQHAPDGKSLDRMYKQWSEELIHTSSFSVFENYSEAPAKQDATTRRTITDMRHIRRQLCVLKAAYELMHSRFELCVDSCDRLLAIPSAPDEVQAAALLARAFCYVCQRHLKAGEADLKQGANSSRDLFTASGDASVAKEWEFIVRGIKSKVSEQVDKFASSRSRIENSLSRIGWTPRRRF
jgi:hypothetical protein